MSFDSLLSCRDGSCVRVNSDLVVAIEPESRQEPSLRPRPETCRVSIANGNQLDVLGEANVVQGTLGLICIRLTLFRGGSAIFLNPSLVFAVEDQSGGDPPVTRSLVRFIRGKFSPGAGHLMAPPLMVRETAWQVMEAISAADETHAQGLGRVLDSCGPCYTAPCGKAIGPLGTEGGEGSHPFRTSDSGGRVSPHGKPAHDRANSGRCSEAGLVFDR